MKPEAATSSVQGSIVLCKAISSILVLKMICML